MLKVLIFLMICFSLNSSQHWRYEEQNKWSRQFRSCGGNRQSPININTRSAKSNPRLTLRFTGYDRLQSHLMANNNGHTVRITFNSKHRKPHISGSAVNGNFVIEEFHFHWGDNSFDGTEHSINNQFGSAELHFVHYNQKYGNFTNARDRSDGIVVLTVFLEVSQNNNKRLNPIVNSLSHIVPFNSSAPIRHKLSLEDLMPLNKDLFFRYKGSLTTPPCSESVTFILFVDPMKIGSTQLSYFRRLAEEPTRGRLGENVRIIKNTRKVQPINGRVVEISGQEYSREPDIDNNVDYLYDY